MGVRYFCDQCGNTISDRKTMNRVICAVSQPWSDDDDEDENYSRKSKTKQETPRKVTVELCEHCLPTWMKRVVMLTEKSNV